MSASNTILSIAATSLSGRLLGHQGGYSAVRLDDNDTINDRYEGVNYHLAMVKPWSWDRHSLNLLLEGGGSTSQEELPLFVQDLGGLFRMSGFQRYQLSGRYSLFGGLRYIYRVADNDFGAAGAALSGGSLEQGGGGTGRRHQHGGSFTAGSVYVGWSFLGPIFLGYGMAEGATTCSICNWAAHSNNGQMMPFVNLFWCAIYLLVKHQQL